MDYKGDSFKAEWADGILLVEFYKLTDDTFNLFNIVLDAAIEQAPFNAIWDFRQAKHPGYLALPKLIYKSSLVYSKTNLKVIRASILVPSQYLNVVSPIVNAINPKDSSYIGLNPIEARAFVN